MYICLSTPSVTVRECGRIRVHNLFCSRLTIGHPSSFNRPRGAGTAAGPSARLQLCCLHHDVPPQPPRICPPIQGDVGGGSGRAAHRGRHIKFAARATGTQAPPPAIPYEPADRSLDAALPGLSLDIRVKWDLILQRTSWAPTPHAPTMFGSGARRP